MRPDAARAGLRILALNVPELPLQRALRARAPGAGEAGRPLAVVSEGRVLHCDPSARAAGVREGGTVAEALAACGGLATEPLDPAADRAALRALAEAMLSLAPAVELAPPDGLLLDASGAHLLAPRARGGAGAGDRREPAEGPGGAAGPGVAPAGEWPPGEGESILAQQVLAAAAEMGWTARAAVATGRGPARAIAAHGRGGSRTGEGFLVVPPGETARAIASLPIEALGLPSAVADRLAGLGIADAGALSRLPPGSLAHRFGPEGVLAARLARGEDDAPLAPFVPETLPEEALDLEAPAEAADPLLFGLKRLADRVAARLAGRGLGATRLKITLALDPRGEERLLVPLATPTASAGRWLLPVKEHLFSLRLPAAVTGLKLAAIEVAPVAPEQLAIGDRPEALAALEGVLARLAVRIGEEALFAAEPVERYLPEGAYRPVPFRPAEARPRPQAALGLFQGARVDAPPPPPRPTRLLAAPAPVVAEGEGGRLTAIRIDGRAREVLEMEGPERLRGEWWSAPFDRDYYRVRLDGLGDCWVFRDGGDGRLYLHGFFD